MVHSAFGPSKWYYVLALAGLTASVLALRLFVDRRVEQIAGSLTHGTVPGAFTVEIPSAGHYGVYLEYQGILDHRLFLTSEDPGALQCALSQGEGEPITLSPPLWKLRYARDHRAGVALLEFRAPRAGTYVLEGRYPQGQPGPELLLAVGEGVLGDLSAGILGGLALALAPAFAGCVLGASVARARKRARRRLYGRYA